MSRRETSPIARFLGTGFAAAIVLCFVLTPFAVLALLLRLIMWAMGVA